MKINYLSHHRWLKPAIENSESLYSKKIKKRIISTLSRAQELNITYEIKLLDEDFLNWFTPIYTKTIGSKQNALVKNLYAETLKNEEKKSEYWSLTLFQDNTPIGATVLGVRDKILITAFKTLPEKWPSGSLQASPSLYVEHVTSEHAHKLGKNTVSHGKDRNPYGVNASVGLANFKLSVGYSPYLPEDSSEYPPQTIDTDTIKTDALILHKPTQGEKITEATLICTKETGEKYNQLLSYSDVIDFEIIYRD